VIENVARVLAVESDPRTAQALRDALSGEPGVSLVVASDALEAIRIGSLQPPHLVLASDRLLASHDWALLRRVHEVPEEHGIVVMVSDPGDHAGRAEALAHGVDGFLNRPLDAAEVRANARGVLRLKRAYDRIRRAREELDQLHRALSASFEQLLQLMAHILDMSLPGAADRGARVASLAASVADRFGVPEDLRRDLAIAARLHELGRVVVTDDEEQGSTTGTTGWTAMLATRAIFERVEGLRTAAEVVGAISENWDGSGRPAHLQQGQIPLRSRILRVVIDYVRALEVPDAPSPAQVMSRLLVHKGARYDPLALVYLEAAVTGGPVEGETDRQVVAIPALEVGMVLADDLYTESGLKLLSRGTRLGPSALEAIQRRHRSEPILHGAAILRRSA
jgi:response regulator RpfG family c-di-GMP phosphodiesterase